jgi:transposase
MSKEKKRYTKAEKLEIVKMFTENGESAKSLASRFGVTENSIYNWIRAFKRSPETAFPGQGNKEMTDAEREIDRLKKELRESQIENAILKKAVGIFSKRDRKFSNL